VGAPSITDARPLAVAHRAGNELHLLHAAEAAGVDLVEADLWFDRGRIEVRHLKTFGWLPIPVLWDRWKLAPGWGDRFTLPELIEASAPTTGLMLDLKGLNPRLASDLIETMATLAPGRPYAVSSQSWDLLEAFREHGHVFVIHSAGNERMLRDVRGRLTWHDRHAVGVDQRLLTPDRVASLRELAPTVFSWRVNTEARMHELLSWGVNGIISDSFEVLAALLRSRAAASAALDSGAAVPRADMLHTEQ
jgi:hypothetical protein